MKRTGSMLSRVVLSLAGVSALALMMVNCGGGEETPGGGAGSGGGAGTGGGTCDPTPIFTAKSCAITGCHSNTMPAGNFDMKTAGWETAMVGKAVPGGGPAGTPSLCGGMNKVYLVAGSSPATGLFLEKLNTKFPPCGVRMPNLPGMELSATEIACIQTWANNLTKAK